MMNSVFGGRLVVEKLNPEYCDYGSGISVELTL
jgi:hypothetical protein